MVLIFEEKIVFVEKKQKKKEKKKVNRFASNGSVAMSFRRSAVAVGSRRQPHWKSKPDDDDDDDDDVFVVEAFLGGMGGFEIGGNLISGRRFKLPF